MVDTLLQEEIKPGAVSGGEHAKEIMISRLYGCWKGWWTKDNFQWRAMKVSVEINCMLLYKLTINAGGACLAVNNS